MPTIGPALPPHLTKRKREDEEDESSPEPERSKTPESSEKRRRIIGPAPPPAPLDELPKSNPKDEEDSSSDDEFGPAVPTGEAAKVWTIAGINYTVANEHQVNYEEEEDPSVREEAMPTTENKPKRMAWMYDPKGQEDLAKRIGLDPSRAAGRARGFNKHSSTAGGNDTWNETPEQRRKRLENEVLGIRSTSTGSTTGAAKAKGTADVQASRKIKENIEKHRGKSLMEQHQKANPKDKEDDPTKRAFDYEKDIGGVRIGNAARRDMINRSQDFGSRFSGGSYL